MALQRGLQRFLELLIEGARAPIRPPTKTVFTLHLQHVGKIPWNDTFLFSKSTAMGWTF
jgi:hypothetical protein